MIRKYHSKDRKRCLELFKSNCPVYFADEELSDFETWLDGQDKEVLAYGNSAEEVYFVIEESQEVIACGGFYIVRNKPLAKMAWGMVDNAHHKKGYGMQLLQYRLDEITKNYPDHAIALATSQHTFPFFEKLGFVVEKITPNGFGEGLDQYDMIRKI